MRWWAGDPCQVPVQLPRDRPGPLHPLPRVGLRQVREEEKELSKPLSEYNPAKTIESGIKGAVTSAAGLALLAAIDALATALQDPAKVSALLGAYPKLLWSAPLVIGIAASWNNWRKNKDR
jgi:hypothetical protein